MIDYATILPGDKLRIVDMGAPGFAKLGDIVEVVSCNMMNRCDVKRADGETAYFALTCGAQRLELVEGATAQSTQNIGKNVSEGGQHVSARQEQPANQSSTKDTANG